MFANIRRLLAYKNLIRIYLPVILLMLVGSYIWSCQYVIVQKDYGYGSVYSCYLSSLYKSKNYDFKGAAELNNQCLKKVITNADFIQNLYYLELLSGDIKDAANILKVHSKIISSPNSILVLVVQALLEQDIQRAKQLLRQTKVDSRMSDIMKLISIIIDAHDSLNKGLMLLDGHNWAGGEYKLAKLVQGLFADMVNDMPSAYEAFGFLENIEQSTQIVHIIGNFYERRGDLKIAKKLYQKYLTFNPYNGVILRDMDRLERNEISINRVVETPEQVLAVLLGDIGNMLLGYNQTAGLQYLQLASALDPISDYYKILIADYYLDQMHYEQAKIVYSSITHASVYYPEAAANLAYIQYKNGNIKQSVASLTNILDHYLSYKALLFLSDVTYNTEDYNRAIKVYSKIIKRIKESKSYHWPIYHMRSGSYHAAHRYSEAEKDSIIADKLSPNNCVIQNDLAYNLVSQNYKLKEAEAIAKDAIKNCPDNPALLDTYGWILFKLGKSAEAINYVNSALDLMPYDLEINNHLGDIYWHIGRYELAKFAWQRAIKLADKEKVKNMLEFKIKYGI
jgi:tetratricopeptide (TPR) repeat protein